MPSDYWVRKDYDAAVSQIFDEIERLRDIDVAVQKLAEYDFVQRVTLSSMDPGTGSALIDVEAPKSLFYQVMEELTGFEVTGDHHLLRLEERAYPGQTGIRQGGRGIGQCPGPGIWDCQSQF